MTNTTSQQVHDATLKVPPGDSHYGNCDLRINTFNQKTTATAGKKLVDDTFAADATMSLNQSASALWCISPAPSPAIQTKRKS